MKNKGLGDRGLLSETLSQNRKEGLGMWVSRCLPACTEPWLCLQHCVKWGRTVRQDCYPSTQEGEQEDQKFRVICSHSEFKAGLGYMTLSQKPGEMGLGKMGKSSCHQLPCEKLDIALHICTPSSGEEPKVEEDK